MNKKTIAISVGDVNGIGLEIALKEHKNISKLVNLVYVVNKDILKQACKKLNFKLPKDLQIHNIDIGKKDKFQINAGQVCAKSGKHSFECFLGAIKLAKEPKNKIDAIVTMPINKQSWGEAGIKYVGHTDVLRDKFKKDAIMMMGCESMYVALLSDHISLKDAIKKAKNTKALKEFLIDFYNYELKDKLNTKQRVAVLGINPHSGDGGVIGKEDFKIKKAIKKANKILKKQIGYDLFEGAIVPDIAFTPNMRKKYKYFVCMYHDQGLIGLKSLYFEQSINISLGLDIKRVSVGHGSAFDIAYKNANPSTKSYTECIKYIINT